MIDQYPSANGVLTSLIWRKTAAGGETSLSGYDDASQALSYTPGQEQVYLNGILLVRGDDYTATNGTSITGLSALAANDFVQINCYNNFSVASVPSISITGTITNSQLAGSISNDKLSNSSITINGSPVSLGGSVSLAGDIESVTAGTGLTGGGTSGSVTLSLDTSAVIQPTIFDAKGDLITASAADTAARLASSGNNGDLLTVDTSTATGLKWAAPAGGSTDFTLLNSGGTALTGAATITVNFTSYNYLNIFVSGGSSASASSEFILRFNSDTASNYRDLSITWEIGGTSAYGTSTGDTSAFMFGKMGGTASATINGSIMVYGAKSTTGVKPVRFVGFGSSAHTGSKAYVGSPIYLSTSAITSVSIISTVGNFDAGTVYIYGAN